MARGLYITGTGPRSGKSVVILGIMEMLAGQTANIGFFRPVNDLSRGCTVTDIVNTVAITAIQAQAGKD